MAPPYGQQAGGMHPTGMHSCVVIVFLYYQCSRSGQSRNPPPPLVIGATSVIKNNCLTIGSSIVGHLLTVTFFIFIHS